MFIIGGWWFEVIVTYQCVMAITIQKCRDKPEKTPESIIRTNMFIIGGFDGMKLVTL